MTILRQDLQFSQINWQSWTYVRKNSTNIWHFSRRGDPFSSGMAENYTLHCKIGRQGIITITMPLPFSVKNGKVIHIQFKYLACPSTCRIIIKWGLIEIQQGFVVRNNFEWGPWQEMSEISDKPHHSPKLMFISGPFFFWRSQSVTGIYNYAFLPNLYLCKHWPYTVMRSISVS